VAVLLQLRDQRRCVDDLRAWQHPCALAPGFRGSSEELRHAAPPGCLHSRRADCTHRLQVVCEQQGKCGGSLCAQHLRTPASVCAVHGRGVTPCAQRPPRERAAAARARTPRPARARAAARRAAVAHAPHAAHALRRKRARPGCARTQLQASLTTQLRAQPRRGARPRSLPPDNLQKREGGCCRTKVRTRAHPHTHAHLR
jgi:hypothetical protein